MTRRRWSREARVLARAPEQTLGNLKRALRRAVLVADPSKANDKAEHATAERTVVLTPLDDGMCELWALLPAPDAMTLWSAITALADQAGQADRKAAREAKAARTTTRSQPTAPRTTPALRRRR